jgi:hypothetical protein
VAAPLCALSLVTYVCRAAWGSGVQTDQRYYWISLATLLFVCGITFAWWRRPPRSVVQSATLPPAPGSTGSP